MAWLVQGGSVSALSLSLTRRLRFRLHHENLKGSLSPFQALARCSSVSAGTGVSFVGMLPTAGHKATRVPFHVI